MATFEVIVLVMAAVLLSAVIAEVLPRVYSPLVQIALGILIASIVDESIDIMLDPDFFLLLFIAPLLFHDAKESNKLGLWKNRRSIISLAIGLVLAITLIIGFALHLLVPSVPLVAAFSLGAALGPTDAVAVSSLQSAAKLTPREKSQLSGEALINDATGVVSFQFAIAAAVTGTFSLLEATTSFLVLFLGGIAVGVVVALLARFISGLVRRAGIESETFHVMFDVTLPFIIYILAELISASGILAVVSAGILLSATNARALGPRASRLNIVSSSVWRVIAFALNGIVFTMLGMQIPKAVRYTWESDSISNPTLLFYVVILSVVLVAVRFIWVFFMNRMSTRRKEKGGRRTSSRRISVSSQYSARPVKGTSLKRDLMSSLITTIGGPKGAVTLSIIFSIPILTSAGDAFPSRQLLIFLGCGIIIVTLLLANFLLPILAPSPKVEKSDDEDKAKSAQAQVDILRSVTYELLAQRNKDNAHATRAVVHAYNQRIAHIRNEASIQDDEVLALRLDVLKYQQEYLLKEAKEGHLDEVAAINHVRRLAKSQNLMSHRSDFAWQMRFTLGHLGLALRAFASNFKRSARELAGLSVDASPQEMHSICERAAIDYLEFMLDMDDPPYSLRAIREQLVTHKAVAQTQMTSRLDVTQFETTTQDMDSIARTAYHIELEKIEEAYDDEKISRSMSRHMRDNVYLMLVDLDGHV